MLLFQFSAYSDLWIFRYFASINRYSGDIIISNAIEKLDDNNKVSPFTTMVPGTFIFCSFPFILSTPSASVL